jgi:pyrimidine-specific ribonucleoside hydrolase
LREMDLASRTGPRIPVIIDCDPGHDDAIALMLAFGCGRLNVLGVTTVAGNTTGENALRNALAVLSLIRAAVPVGRGADSPMLRPLETARDVHGESGLEGLSAPRPELRGSDLTAVEFLSSALRQSPVKVTLVPTGPLTNIAIAFLAFPDIRAKIERVVLMGGAAGEGNRTPSAEFNIMTDPEAARVVFESGVPITMVGLDVTHKALIYPREVEALRESGRVGAFAAGLLDFYSRSYRSKGFEGNPVHDALAVAAVFDEGVITTRHVRVDIETRGEFTAGRTVVDFGGVTGRPPNARVAVGVDRDRFIAHIMNAIAALDAGVWRDARPDRM